MTTDENKTIYRRYIDKIFNNATLELIDEFLSPSYVYHDAPPGTPPGPDAIRQVVTMFHAGFPDMKITLDEQVAEGEFVCSQSTMRATHTGTIFGIPATGNAIVMKGLTMVRIVDGLITDSWVKNDVMGLMQQLRA